jgi:hypothetical protein
MQNKIEKILAELYVSDPSLKRHDAVLRKLVLELIEVRPNTNFDEHFRQELRRRLVALAETQQNKTSLTFNFMKRFQFAGAGIAMVALLVASVWYLSEANIPGSNLTSMLSGPKITRAGDNAFGSLSNVQQASGRGGSNASAQEGLAAAPTSDAAMGSGGGTDAKIMIAPENPINFRYVYTGDELTLVEGKVDVLKRNKNENNSSFSDFINRISLGLVNLNSFNSTQLQAFTFAEDKDLGYMVNVSMTEGSVNINENWSKWMRYAVTCAAPQGGIGGVAFESCAQPRKIDISEVPADDVLINAANAFLEEKGIPRGNYGEPFVNNEWRAHYERATDKTNIWIPEMVNVVYPLILEGQAVYDESGNRNGMNVAVRFSPEVRVSSVWDLTTQNYQSSSYQAETDVKRIMDLVARGGFRSYYYSEPGARTVDIELGTPEVSFVKVWNYKDGNSEELLVPALIFPVTKEPASNLVGPYYWYKKNVVIPLVKEILDNEPSIDPIRIMETPVEDVKTMPAPTR